ncbi:diguanylate cyclase [Maritimibacter sp. HL-12]|uniref:diguanylate cyclase n=1 Tax=Maritimibacter sp. HL-12 TaxID=1162418 RepID=UPI000A0F1B07|nr:diguanylate cyclase [Maritimibacter sp. HL-12]SMH33035.1 two-component system, cell cycle response regulator [Maritimibacter sp. HL-12]
MAGRILIADSTATNRIVLKVKLAAARYQTVQAVSGSEALAIARATRPDLVIIDAHLAECGGACLCARLKADPETRAIPVLVIDGAPSQKARLAALRAGADDYLAKPLDEPSLLALVRALMRTRATHDELARRQNTAEALGFAEPVATFTRQAQVTLIAPAAETALGWRRALGARHPAQFATSTRTQALDAIGASDASDAFVIAADLARHGDGIGLVSELRSRGATRHAVIIILDEANAPGTVAMALDIGASAVVSGSFDAEEIAIRLETLLARKNEADMLRNRLDERLGLALRDPLTGLYNRRYGNAYLDRMITGAAKTGQPFALMLLDLDRFKTVNDSFGHVVGDEVLIEAGKRLGENLREIDLLARYGGEEFVIALPETGLEGAQIAAERLRRVIGETPICLATQGVEVPVTVSIGVAVYAGGAQGDTLPTPQNLIEQADAALYASKSDGRNLVTFAGGRAA